MKRGRKKKDATVARLSERLNVNMTPQMRASLERRFEVWRDAFPPVKRRRLSLADLIRHYVKEGLAADGVEIAEEGGK